MYMLYDNTFYYWKFEVIPAFINQVIQMAIDPICKMEVDEATAKFTSEFKGNTYYFCAPGCKAEFEANPEKYV